MDALSPLVNHFQHFLLVWARMSAVLFLAPALSAPVIPDRLRLILGFMISLCVFPWVSKISVPIPADVSLLVLAIVKEVMVGVCIGFFVGVLFAAFSLSTQFFTTQIGLGMSQVFDPITQEETPVLSSLFTTVALLVFISIGGMHMIVRATVDSYTMLPAIDVIAQKQGLLDLAVRYFGLCFVVALKMAFPVIAASTVIVIVLGLAGKAAPQMNIMVLGLPLQLGGGLLFLIFAVPAMLRLFGSLFENAVSDVIQLLSAMKVVT